MAEEIKKVLLECSKEPQIRPFIFKTRVRLGNVIERVKEMDYETFVEVFEYAKSLNLLKEFQDDLEAEAENRGYKSNR